MADSRCPSCLLHRVEALLERTYALPRCPLDPARFIIGDAGLRTLSRDWPLPASARERAGLGSAGDAHAMLLVRMTGACAAVRLYYPDALVANLERHDPARGVGAENVRDLAAFVEELDHFLLLVSRAVRQHPTRGLEMELHANVSKVLVVSLFVARTRGVARLDARERAELRHEVLGRGDFEPEPPDLRERYLLARRHAWRFLDRLERVDGPARLALLRSFSRASLPDKLALCA